MVEAIKYYIENREELEKRKELIAEKASVLFGERSVGNKIMKLFIND
jgi:hypothetical protein